MLVLKRTVSSIISIALIYLRQRIGFGVTIVVEGGINTCLAILNDIQCGRPVVLIQVLVKWCMHIYFFAIIIGKW